PPTAIYSLSLHDALPIFLGISDYQNENYMSAIARWKVLLPLLQPDSDVARSVRNEIADAEARRDGREPPQPEAAPAEAAGAQTADRKSTRLNSSHDQISY